MDRAEVCRGPQINVTPLIDVLLTLIIMFMVVVSMDKTYQEKTQIPQPDQKQTAEQPQSSTIVIQVVWTAKGQPPSVKINRDDVRWEDLGARLTQIYLKRAREGGVRPRRCGRGLSVCRRRDRSWRITLGCSEWGC